MPLKTKMVICGALGSSIAHRRDPRFHPGRGLHRRYRRALLAAMVASRFPRQISPRPGQADQKRPAGSGKALLKSRPPPLLLRELRRGSPSPFGWTYREVRPHLCSRGRTVSGIGPAHGVHNGVRQTPQIFGLDTIRRHEINVPVERTHPHAALNEEIRKTAMFTKHPLPRRRLRRVSARRGRPGIPGTAKALPQGPGGCLPRVRPTARRSEDRGWRVHGRPAGCP